MEATIIERLQEELLHKSREELRQSDMLVIYEEWCKACGICYKLCPQGTIKADSHGKVYIAYPETCTGCRICELHCPDYAIIVIGKPRKAPKAPELQKEENK